MRELRVQSGGRPLRLFCAFDPRQTSILLIDGYKTDNDQPTRSMCRWPATLLNEHMADLRKEGLID